MLIVRVQQSLYGRHSFGKDIQHDRKSFTTAVSGLFASAWLLLVCVSTRHPETPPRSCFVPEVMLTCLQTETPWVTEMASSPARVSDDILEKSKDDLNPPTIAAFSPNASASSPATRQRSTIIVHRKSPLLVATPPTVTRALAFSHPFLLPLNQLVGLITWSSGDPWESFLIVAGFWAITLYGDVIIRYAGPLLVVTCVILGMYSRRYSPLSSSGWTNEKFHDSKKNKPEGKMRHQKSLDEIVETLTVFTSRCNILLEPFMQFTDFLSTQRTATSATTRPALTTMFIRILFITPVWIAMTLPPFYILSTRRVLLAGGTLMLSWHSRPARVSRAVLWRSKFVRRIISATTGLDFGAFPSQAVPIGKSPPPPLPPRRKNQHDVANSLAASGRAEPAGVRFTFVVFENQRRWLGLGWTYQLLAYERAPWTDEHFNSSDPKDEFKLPEVENGNAKWRWVLGSEWQIEGGGKRKASIEDDGWIYYDNKWHDGRRGQDGWGRYTRRRKWYRDAELVETSPDIGLDGSTDTLVPLKQNSVPSNPPSGPSHAVKDGSDSSSSQKKRRGFFRRRASGSSAQSSGDFSGTSTLRDDENDTQQLPSHQERDGYWGVGDDVRMGLE